jgi:hypothetical protein
MYTSKAQIYLISTPIFLLQSWLNLIYVETKSFLKDIFIDVGWVE